MAAITIRTLKQIIADNDLKDDDEIHFTIDSSDRELRVFNNTIILDLELAEITTWSVDGSSTKGVIIDFYLSSDGECIY